LMNLIAYKNIVPVFLAHPVDDTQTGDATDHAIKRSTKSRVVLLL